MPARLFHINLRNLGAADIDWVEDHLDHGEWADPWLPSTTAKSIKPGAVGSWESESGGDLPIIGNVFTGTEGRVVFRTRSGDDTDNHEEWIRIHWSAPYIGSIQLFPPHVGTATVDIQIKRYDLSGDDPQPGEDPKANDPVVVQVRLERRDSGNQENFWNEIQNAPELLALWPASLVTPITVQHHVYLDLVVSGSKPYPQISFGSLDEPKLDTVEGLFQATNQWAIDHGYIGAFPNFHEADYGRGKEFGTILLKKEAADIKEISLPELGNPQTPEAMIRAINNYVHPFGFTVEGQASILGPLLGIKSILEIGGDLKSIYSPAYIGALPTFTLAHPGQNKVYRFLCIKKEAAVWHDFSAVDLGNPQKLDARFRAVNDYTSRIVEMTGFKKPNTQNSSEVSSLRASLFGRPSFARVYLGGFPNYYEANTSQGKILGSILIKSEYADWADINYSQLFPRPIIH
jgi:hypothetical protein